MSKQIEVVAYNPDWPILFEQEAQKIKKVVGDNCLAIYHVGSTSIPGLPAKPVIDMIGVMKDPEKAIKPLETLGFLHKGEYNIPFRYYFNRSEGIATNLHVYEEGRPEIELNLMFRDYLRNHPEEKEKYSRLKEDLVKEEASFQKNNSMFRGYTLGKDDFIRNILKKAQFNRLRMTKCTHYAEQDAAKKLRQIYFKDREEDDANDESLFTRPGHIHLMFHQGVEIIGYAHIQLHPNQKAELRVFLFNHPYQRDCFGSEFLRLCEQWLQRQGAHSLYYMSDKQNREFFTKQGFNKTTLNDLAGTERSERKILIEKFL